MNIVILDRKTLGLDIDMDIFKTFGNVKIMIVQNQMRQ